MKRSVFPRSLLALFLAALIASADVLLPKPTETVDMSPVQALDGKKIVLIAGEAELHAYPVEAFRNVEADEWTGSPKGKEDLVNRDCVIAWGKELLNYSLPGVTVYVLATPIDNCFATLTEAGEPIIAMDPFFLRERIEIVCDRLFVTRDPAFAGLEPKEGGYWLSGMRARASDVMTQHVREAVLKSILWHEWAHHDLGHVTAGSAPDEEQALREEDADALAGYWIGWYRGLDGVAGIMDEEHVQDTMVEAFCSLGGLHPTDHPSKMARMQAACDGYDDGLMDRLRLRKNPPRGRWKGYDEGR